MTTRRIAGAALSKRGAKTRGSRAWIERGGLERGRTRCGYVTEVTKPRGLTISIHEAGLGYLNIVDII